MKVTGQFADKLRAHSLHLLFTYVALVATTSPDASVRVEITAVCKVCNASHTGCLKNHANIVNKIHRTFTRTFNYFALSFLIMHHCSIMSRVESSRVESSRAKWNLGLSILNKIDRVQSSLLEIWKQTISQKSMNVRKDVS